MDEQLNLIVLLFFQQGDGTGNSIRSPTTLRDKIQYFKELVFAYMVIIDKILNDQVA